MAEQAGILFCAFEPSGDAVAAPVIAQLRREQPQRPIYALGGPRMAEAGAQLIEHTTENAVMLLGAASQAIAHKRRLARLKQWLSSHNIAAVAPTDSPAANWSICRLVKRMQPQAKVVHLVAPQLWAWGQWRTRKLRGLTDHVLCLLPFEPDWLNRRGIKATFVGHPLFNKSALQRSTVTSDALPGGEGPRLALLPGSRTSEVQANWRMMLGVYEQLRQKRPDLRACVAASDEKRAELLRSMLPNGHLPEGMTMLTSDASAVLDWADAAVVVSGTATLHAASRKTPMVVVYNVSQVMWQVLGRWLIRTRTFSLPNLIGEWMNLGRVVPELVPHDGQVQPVVDELEPLLNKTAAYDRQLASFDAIANCFMAQNYEKSAVRALLETIADPAVPTPEHTSVTPTSSRQSR